MSEAVPYQVADLGHQDYERLDIIVDNLLRVASVARILKDLGEPYDDLIPLVKHLASELTLELHTSAYVSGTAEELYRVVKLRLWDLGGEPKLAELIDDLVELSAKVREGIADEILARRVLSDFISVFSVDVSNCSILRELLKRCDPRTAVQTVLVGLIVAVDGVGYQDW